MYDFRKRICVDALLFEEMFDRVITFRQGSVYQEVLKEIGDRTNLLGSGAYGSVYENEKNSETVFKIGEANTNGGYLTYVRLLQNAKQNPHFPTITRKDLYYNKSTGDAWFLFEIEKLVRYSEVTDGDDNLPAKYHNMKYFDFADSLRNHLYKEDAKKKLPFEMPDTWYEAIETVIAARNSRYNDTGWDLNWSNIMFREQTLDLVITDPMV